MGDTFQLVFVLTSTQFLVLLGQSMVVSVTKQYYKLYILQISNKYIGKHTLRHRPISVRLLTRHFKCPIFEISYTGYVKIALLNFQILIKMYVFG